MAKSLESMRDKVEAIQDILDGIRGELDWVVNDAWEDEDMFSDDEKQQIPKEFTKIEKHLKATIKLMTWLGIHNQPEWSK